MPSDREQLLSLQAVRAQAGRVLKAAKANRLNHFDFDASRMSDAADYVCNLIERDFGPDKYDTIPPHGRWQHFDVGNVDRVGGLIDHWSKETNGDEVEITRRLIDLFFVSVLLDAGAGDVWRFKEPETGHEVVRSEGIAVASLHMFTAGAFSSDESSKEKVDGKGLVSLQEADFNKYFQISEENPMVGVSSRVQLLRSVGSSLLALPDIFGAAGRPGNLVDYLTSRSQDSKILDYEELWCCLQKLLIPSWPKNRTVFEGEPIGDAWPLRLLATLSAEEGDTREVSKIHPFHKLTQWLAYSLSVPFQRRLKYDWKSLGLGTGLPEYRNGGLFVDLGVLRLKEADLEIGRKASGQELPEFDSSDDVIVEWRAMTVALLDELHGIVNAKFQQKGVSLTIPQMLEAGTWKSGRELAATNRPQTKSSPILVISDGTLY
ncbi:Uracil catabolism protein [Paramyrothecium foliicola]|nr:Uracil catabolism protein [Paramyrothecium foliicola]